MLSERLGEAPILRPDGTLDVLPPEGAPEPHSISVHGVSEKLKSTLECSSRNKKLHNIFFAQINIEAIRGHQMSFL